MSNNHKELRDRLRRIVDDIHAPKDSLHWYDSVSKLTEVSEEEFSALLDLIDRLERENEELRKDAERWRHHRADEAVMFNVSPDEVDDARDAAMKEEDCPSPTLLKCNTPRNGGMTNCHGCGKEIPQGALCATCWSLRAFPNRSKKEEE